MHRTNQWNTVHRNAVLHLVSDVDTVLVLMRKQSAMEISIVMMNQMKIIYCAVIQRVEDHNQQPPPVQPSDQHSIQIKFTSQIHLMTFQLVNIELQMT